MIEMVKELKAKREVKTEVMALEVGNGGNAFDGDISYLCGTGECIKPSHVHSSVGLPGNDTFGIHADKHLAENHAREQCIQGPMATVSEPDSVVNGGQVSETSEEVV